MKRFITVLILLVGSNSICTGACPEQIKTFYTAYLNNILHNNSENDVLCKTYLTDELIDKVDRLGNATGADPIIRAQDANQDAIKTLTVEDLANNWYLVVYFWKNGDNSTRTEIPLKAQEIGGKCKITYITPIWNGSQYGDELLTCTHAETNSRDQSSELSFLRSFYNTYLFQYCAMPKDLSFKLSSLRAHHLSQKALDKFKQAELENQEDGLVGYDLLIDNFDFDCLWQKEIRFQHLNGLHYQITYRGGDKEYKIIVTIRRENDNYLIDGISL